MGVLTVPLSGSILRFVGVKLSFSAIEQVFRSCGAPLDEDCLMFP